MIKIYSITNGIPHSGDNSSIIGYKVQSSFFKNSEDVISYLFNQWALIQVNLDEVSFIELRKEIKE